MVRYVIRRLLWAVVLFIAVTVVTYIIFFMIPLDPAKLAAGKSATPQEVVGTPASSVLALSKSKSATTSPLKFATRAAKKAKK